MHSSHLDLGCGIKPRNPYDCQKLYGVDIRHSSISGWEVRSSNLAYEPIPFESSFFDSVSAYDFIEHIPRLMFIPQIGTIFPFVNLMSEIHRVLKPNGIFYAETPCYPAPQIFQDPTHVNFITKDTHLYFCGDSPDAEIYKFNGKFAVNEVAYIDSGKKRQPINPKGIMRVLRKFKSPHTHIMWELRAIK